MVGGKLFKTKLCVLYQRGHCNRHSCSFAHGEAELRSVGFSSSGRQDYRDIDLRNRIGRRYSPRRRYSPIKDARSRHTFRMPNARYSPSRSLEDNSLHLKTTVTESARRTTIWIVKSDVSAKLSDGSDYARGGRSTLSDSKHTLQEQLKQVKSDISMLDHNKVQLEIYLEEHAQEADSLASKIQELEGQVHREKKEFRRINSRIKKFVKAHHRFSRLQDELKRSQIQLQNLGLDAFEGGNKEEDSSINVVSDGEKTNNHAGSPQDEVQACDSPSMKVPDLNQAAHEELQLHGRLKFSRWTYSHRMHGEEFYTVNRKNSSSGLSGVEHMHKRENNISSAISSGDKVAPSARVTGDVIDKDADKEAEVASSQKEEAAAFQNKRLSFEISPLPPIRKRSYRQHVGDDENVDLVGGLEHTEKVDITNTS